MSLDYLDTSYLCPESLLRFRDVFFWVLINVFELVGIVYPGFLVFELSFLTCFSVRDKIVVQIS